MSVNYINLFTIEILMMNRRSIQRGIVLNMHIPIYYNYKPKVVDPLNIPLSYLASNKSFSILLDMFQFAYYYSTVAYILTCLM